jgi:hypothetical protein
MVNFGFVQYCTACFKRSVDETTTSLSKPSQWKMSQSTVHTGKCITHAYWGWYRVSRYIESR